MSEPTSVAGDEDQSLDIPCSTSLEIPGRTIERYVGLCWGLTVRSVGLAKGITPASRRARPRPRRQRRGRCALRLE